LPNRAGKEIVLTRNNPDSDNDSIVIEYLPSNAELGNQPSVKFNQQNWLENDSDFAYFSGVQQFTRIVVAARDGGVQAGSPSWDSSTDFETRFGGNKFWASSSYDESAVYGNSQIPPSVTATSSSLNPEFPDFGPNLTNRVVFISLSTFDSLKSDGRNKKLVTRFNNKNVKFKYPYIDGLPFQTTNDTNHNNGDYDDPVSGTAIRIGANSLKGWDGEVAEVIYLDKVLTPEEISIIETYLTEKYSIP